MFILNQLRAGTGPFQRAIRLDDRAFDITILSCYDTKDEVRAIAGILRPDFGARKVLGLGIRNRLQLALALGRYILAEKPDLIQTSHTFSTIVAILVRRLFGLGVVVTFEGTLFIVMGRVKRLLLQFVLSFADGAICVSNAVERANRFHGFRAKPSKRIVIYNGVDHTEIERAQLVAFNGIADLKTERLTFGFVGDLKPVKSVHTLLNAFALISARVPESQLLMVGGGPLISTAKNQAAKLGISDRVVFTGHIQRHEVYSALKKMDVFIMPSLIEGLSEAIAQAMASSLPVIASNIEPNRELIEEDCNGLLFSVGNDQELADKMIKLAEEPQTRLEFGRRNKELSIKFLDINNVVAEYKAFYLHVMKLRNIS